VSRWRRRLADRPSARADLEAMVAGAGLCIAAGGGRPLSPLLAVRRRVPVALLLHRRCDRLCRAGVRRAADHARPDDGDAVWLALRAARTARMAPAGGRGCFRQGGIRGPTLDAENAARTRRAA